MPRFQSQSISAEQVHTGILTIGAPPGRPGARSTQQVIHGSPEGALYGTRGDVAIDVDEPAIWIKTGSETISSASGWIRQGSGGAANDSLAYGLRVVGLNAGAHVGSTATAVLRFDDQATPDFPALPLAAWVVQTNDAAQGTTFQITMQGRYVATLSMLTDTNAPGEAVSAGISLDCPDNRLTFPPLMGFSSAFQCNMQNADDSFPAAISCSTPLFVTDEMIAAGRGIVRAHGDNGAFASVSHTGFVLRRMGDCSLTA